VGAPSAESHFQRGREGLNAPEGPAIREFPVYAVQASPHIPYCESDQTDKSEAAPPMAASTHRHSELSGRLTMAALFSLKAKQARSKTPSGGREWR
jgi:hypothetical protein